MAEGADWLAWMLGSTAGEVARRNPHQDSTAVPPEQVDITHALMQLERFLSGFIARIVPGDIRPGEWEMLAKVFAALTRECHRQGQRVVLDGGDARLDLDGEVGG